MAKQHGGKILADRLASHGVSRVFSVPGESFLAALDGIYERGIRNIVCRQEGGAAMMAEASAKLKAGQHDGPGVLFVTRGPGATNASAGLHIAMHDATPLVCFVGQAPLKFRDRDVFQEVDYRAFFGPLVKWVAEVEDPNRIAEYVDRGFQVAGSGRPGPVVIALPEDVLSAAAEALPFHPSSPVEQKVSPTAAHRMLNILNDAKRPMIVVGGSDWSHRTAGMATDVAERLGAPIAVTFRRQDYIDNDHPNYAGDLGVGMNPKLGLRLSEADTILLVGAELNDITTKDFSLIDAASPPRIIQTTLNPEGIGKHYPAEMSLAVSSSELFTALRQALPAAPSEDRGAAAARADYEAWQTPQPTPGNVRLEEVMCWLRDNADPKTIITNGAGNYAAFLHRYYRFRAYGTQVAPTSGSMGYGLPAAIAAKLNYPERTVVCFSGDGCIQMTLQELSTARQHGVDIIVIVCNNGRYGTIRMHQEMHYPGRVSGTDLYNPDYVTLAKAYGGTGHLIEEQDQFAEAYRAAEKGGLHIIELQLDPQMLSTTANLPS